MLSGDGVTESEMLRKAVLLPLLALLLSPAAGHALGLGEIRVLSSLNEPLAAEIALTDLRAGELDQLQVRLASTEAFARIGLDRPFLLTQLQFAATRNDAGEPVVAVTTREAVREPFLLFLIEANWSRGRLLREYTVLLDPPVLMPAVASTVQPARTAPTESARTQDTPAESTRRMPESFGGRIPEDRMRAGPGDYGAIQRNETLWSIAERVKPSPDITTSQMMLALFEANPDAFYGNINRMKTGYVLRVPAADVALARSAADAYREVARQNEAWRTGEEVDFRIAEAGPAGGGDQLRLSAPASGDAGEDPAGTADGDDGGLRQRLADAEGAVAEEREARESLADRLVELEEEAERLRRQLEIRNAEIAALTGAEPEPVASPAETEAAPESETEAAPDTAPETATAAEPETAQADTRRQVRRPEPEPTLLERLTNPVVLGALLGVLVLIALVVTALRRRRAAAEASKLLAPEGDDEATQFAAVDAEGEQTVVRDEGAMAPAESAPEPEAEEPPAEDMTSSGIVGLDESDPTSEADFHLAYGLYDQAADLMEGAYKEHPDRVPYLMKLLEIYFSWGKADEFVAHAREGRKKLEAAGEWGNVAILGRQMVADEPLFSGDMASTGARAGVDLDVEDEGGEAEMDIDTGTFGGDFDLGEPEAEEQAAEAPAESPASAGNEMEFDLGDFEYPTDEAAAAPEAEAPAEPAAADDANELEFDLGLGDEAAAPEPASEPEPEPEADSEATQFKVDTSTAEDSLDLDIDSALAGLDAEESDTIESALGGDDSGTTDFDLGALDEPADDGAHEASIEASPADEAGDLDFDALLGDDAGGDDVESADAGSGDSRLDLARAYIDMGDADGARGLLNEVLADGTDAQKQEAQELLNLIS